MDFSALLDQKADDVEKPVDPPQGMYGFELYKPFSETRTANGAWDIVEFPLRAFEADEDIDPDDLEAYGPLNTIINRASFLFSTDPEDENGRLKALNQLKTFLEKVLQIDPEGKSVKEMMAEATGCKCYGILSWKQDGEEIRVNAGKFTPYE